MPVAALACYSFFSERLRRVWAPRASFVDGFLSSRYLISIAKALVTRRQAMLLVSVRDARGAGDILMGQRHLLRRPDANLGGPPSAAVGRPALRRFISGCFDTPKIAIHDTLKK